MELNKLNHFDVIIVGGGPAGLMTAYICAVKGKRVAVMDHKATVGRKFLVAGDGGLNLSNTENLEDFVSRYNHDCIKSCVRKFTPDDLRTWMEVIGVQTFVGSSGKIFPKENFNPAQVLKHIVDALVDLKVEFFTKHKFIDFTNNSAVFEFLNNKVIFTFDQMILALGGKSWQKTGSDGSWVDIFESKNIKTTAFRASNAGFNVVWDDEIELHFGKVIQNVNLKLGGKSKFGNLVISEYGLEGTPVYWLNAEYREQGYSDLIIDFLPHKTNEEVFQSLSNKIKFTDILRNKLKLKSSAIALIKSSLTKDEFNNPVILSKALKSLVIKIEGIRSVEEAISTVGGVAWSEMDDNFKLNKFPSIYCAGEMLDWDAPTGGYLLQAAFASGFTIAQGICSIK
jgi:uncharacterized flavoprotein (TIGR03862 family)